MALPLVRSSRRPRTGAVPRPRGGCFGGIDGGDAGWGRSVRERRRSALNRFRVRRLTAGLRQWPDYVVIGTQRAGTTSLNRWINAHPQSQAARTPRELHYFDLNYERGPNWYRSNFPLRLQGRITGESTPYMLFHPLAPERAAHDLPPTTRFIVLLRDPVERAISHYWLNRRRHDETEPFPGAIESETERLAGQEEVVLRRRAEQPHRPVSYVSRGQYAEQVERWFRIAGRDRLLVVQCEELFASAEVGNDIPRLAGARAHRTGPFPRATRQPAAKSADADVVARTPPALRAAQPRLWTTCSGVASGLRDPGQTMRRTTRSDPHSPSSTNWPEARAARQMS